jgi:peptidoglycan-associated lipoprotein
LRRGSAGARARRKGCAGTNIGGGHDGAMFHRVSRNKHTLALTLGCLVALPLGCKKKTDTEVPTSDAPTASQGQKLGDQDNDPGKAGIVIDDRIASLCDIPTAHFDFDSSALSPQARAALDALASCFIDGPAKGKGMRMVGHADPRGTEEYNFGLGQRRAGSVATYITNRGLAESAIETSSRGELDAKGSDEDTWARDRKVEIFLAD